MLGKTIAGILIALFMMSALLTDQPAGAQGADGWATYQINMRSGAGTTYAVVARLNTGTELIFEARNADISWLLAHTMDGAQRGWVAALYIGLRDGYGRLTNLPLSDEVIATRPPAPQVLASAPIGTESTTAVLMNQPVIPVIGGRVDEIFQVGQMMGNRRDVFTIIGGCNSLARAFMQPFGLNNYTLGMYGDLQSTIDFYLQTPVDGTPNSFFHKGMGVHTGFTAVALNDPVWADPAHCQIGETPLICEYRRSRPGVALIMLGLFDVYWYTPEQYEANMRQIIETSIQQGVIPVLTTFPTTDYAGEGTSEFAGTVGVDDRALYRVQFNLILVRLAHEYGVPLMNLWQAALNLPHRGFREGDFVHFWEPDDPRLWGALNGGQNQSIFPMWNLVALQTLDALRLNVLGG